MKFRLRTPVFALIAIVSGATILLGYFIRIPFLQDLSEILLHWALILTAVALGVGVINLLSVHFKKIKYQQKNRFSSLALVISFLVTLIVAIVFGPASRWSVWIFSHVLLPVETSLVALLAVILVYALARMFWRGVNLFTLLFAATVLFTLAVPALLSWISLPLIGELGDWIGQVWALAGARAILFGVGLGIIATGLRVLIGADRPYEG